MKPLYTRRLNKNWYLEVIKSYDNKKPYIKVVGEFSQRKSDVCDYPIYCQYHIAYDYPEQIPQFVKNAVRKLYDRFPVCKCEKNLWVLKSEVFYREKFTTYSDDDFHVAWQTYSLYLKDITDTDQPSCDTDVLQWLTSYFDEIFLDEDEDDDTN